MRLTPIKVRGRGPRKKGFIPPPPKQLPSKAIQNADDSTAIGLSAKRRRRGRKPPSLIEQVPLEILQHIFLLSGNLNLPRATPRLGYFLSSRSCLVELVFEAFAPTWDVWFGCTHTPGWVGGQLQSYYGYSTDAERFGGDPELQSAVLTCHWARLSLLLDAQQIWVRRHGRHRYFEHLTFAAVPPDSSHGFGGLGHLTSVHDCFEHDWAAFLSSPTSASEPQTIYVGTHPHTQLPEDLITGTFDWEGARHLFWLFCQGVAAPCGDGGWWEITKAAFERVMDLDDDALALVLLRLFERWGFFGAGKWPDHVREEVVAELERRHGGSDPALPKTCEYAMRILTLSEERGP
ncbi:hypothetical protein VTK73DRAFT_2480 [Phialemonium thermophilum]|uniref:Uncharacterized protein n=1 Tax=Phialemonium thermophilum TaxID=223376 RepID=A0ABR3Y2F6_9PEZI